MSTGGSILSGHCTILRPSQWPLVRHLRLEALLESPTAFFGDYDRESSFGPDYWQGTFADGSWHAFLLDGTRADPELVAGIAKSTVMTEFPDERYVEKFWVRPAYREKQVARRMVHNIAHEARRDRRQAIRLSVLRTNTDAIKAFNRLGFATEVPHRSREYEICLELPLE